MSYRPRPEFDQPTAESVQRWRRTTIWLLPLVIVQQGTTIFRQGGDRFDHLLGTVCWVIVSISILWMLLGLPLRWLSERDQMVLNDERSRLVSAGSCQWGLVAMVGLGCAIIIARNWVAIDAGLAVYALVNGALIVAVARYTWLNRPERGEDE